MRVYRQSFFSKLYGLQRDIRKSIKEAKVSTCASSAAFFLFLSIFPSIMLVSGLLPYDVISGRNALNISQAVIPEKVYGFLMGIAGSCNGSNMTLMSVSALVVIWSASRGVLALIRGLNHIYAADELVNDIVLRLKAAFYTVLLLLAGFLFAGLIVFGNAIVNRLAADNEVLSRLWRVAGVFRHILAAGAMSVVFCTMYGILTDNRLTWRENYPGAVFTSVFWTLYSFGFSVYVDYFGGFSMYGSLTAIIIVMIWLYFCMYIFFCGALVNKWIAEGYIDDYMQML